MILITGGLGYLGGRIAAHLILAGFKVRIASSRKFPKIPSVLSSCEIVYVDFFDNTSLESACNNVSTILHLAGINAANSSDDPESALLINGLGTLKLLRAAEKEEVNKFLFFSTIHVYGYPLINKIDETKVPNPSNHYSISNRLAEDYVMLASQSGKIFGAIVRLSNAVGRPIDDESNCWSLVVNDLCRQAVQFNHLKLNSDGKQQRDFIPISNICDAVELLIGLPESKYNRQIFNLGGKVFTIYEIALLIAECNNLIFGINIEVEVEKNCNKEVISNNLHFNTNKLASLGFKQNNNLRSEIDLLLKFCANK
jgi:UDP-glucose 4-epimerase